MGTHPSGPSLVSLQAPLRSLTPLADMLHLNPALAGERRYRYIYVCTAIYMYVPRERDGTASP